MLGDNLTAKQLEILQAIRAGSMKSELEGLAEENKKSEDAVEWKKVEAKPAKAELNTVDKEGGKSENNSGNKRQQKAAKK